MKLISWNLNGYRAAISKDIVNPLMNSGADVIVFQETKAQSEQIDASIFEGYYAYMHSARAAISKDIVNPLMNSGADVIVFQETKAQSEQIDASIFEGYYAYMHSAEKKGYSGTMVLTKVKPSSISYGINVDEFDHEGRVITLEYDNCYVVCVYVPNSQNELKRLNYRVQWDKVFTNYLHQLDLIKPVLIGGDFNVAHKPMDLKNPKSNERNAGYTIEERNGFTELLAHGFIDSYRYLHPDTIEYSWWDLKNPKSNERNAGYTIEERNGFTELLAHGFIDSYRYLHPDTIEYSWWSYRFNSRAKNIGWRIDYWLVSNRIKDSIQQAWIETSWLGSDHAPIGIEVSL